MVDQLPPTVAGREIGKQVLRSGTSIGANMREAGSAESHKDFVHKVLIARKEAQETHFWLELVAATILMNNPEVKYLVDEADQLARILYAISHHRSAT